MSTTFRRSSYYSRVLVPTDLRGILQRRDYLKSLHTDSYREAVVRARLWEARVAQAFGAIRARRLAEASRRDRQSMTPEQAQEIVKRYLDGALREADEERLMRPARSVEEDLEEDKDGVPDYGPIVEGLHEEQDQLTKALDRNDFQLVEPIADGLLKDEDGVSAVLLELGGVSPCVENQAEAGTATTAGEDRGPS